MLFSRSRFENIWRTVFEKGTPIDPLNRLKVTSCLLFKMNKTHIYRPLFKTVSV